MMLDKLHELSTTIWNPVGNIIYDLYESAGIWLPIIVFFVTVFLSLYLLRKFLDKVVILPFTQILKILVTFLIKLSIILIVLGLVGSLGYYIYLQYDNYQDKNPTEQQRNFGHLLK